MLKSYLLGSFHWALSFLLHFSMFVSDLLQPSQEHRLSAFNPLVKGAASQVIWHGVIVAEAPFVHRGEHSAEFPNLRKKKDRAKVDVGGCCQAVCQLYYSYRGCIRIDVFLISVAFGSQRIFITCQTWCYSYIHPLWIYSNYAVLQRANTQLSPT